jgi:hypothetical protein
MAFWRRAIILFVLLGPPIGALIVYTGLVFDGTVTPPDFEGWAKDAVPLATGGIALAIGIAIAAIVICAIIAPLLYAARSGDVLTVLVSLVLTLAAVVIFASAKSAIQEILGVLVYLANTVLTVTVYAAHRIARPN